MLRGGEPRPEPSPDCLDAETLAAWTDRGLDAAGHARAEAHMASCAYCQSVMAALSNTPVIAPAAATGAAPADNGLAGL